MISSREVMTSIFDPGVRDSYTTLSKDSNDNICQRHRNVLRSKENTYKHKCKKILKRKLKKYKLRQDGKEDQDIIDVSDTLVSSLFIRSPNKVKDSVEIETEQFRQKNYLFRMVRRKQTTLKTTKISKSLDKVEIVKEDEGRHVSPTTEEKKQTNAFKLLMESRNKSIGTNSPGKEKPNNELGTQEFIEKKTIKAKRTLMLQKMAEEKGALKKKVIEEQHEKYIKKKMEKRAEKLKSMILHKEPKSNIDGKGTREEKNNKYIEQSPLDSIDTEKNRTNLEKPNSKLQVINLFSETIEKKISPEKKLITKEDEEFLKKLSPSIRKKESMLSYFKKIEKEPENVEADNENDNAIIKVKLGSKPKKRKHKKKLSLNRDTDKCEVQENQTENTELDSEILIVIEVKEEETTEETNNIESKVTEISKERRKRKREVKESTNIDSPIANDNNPYEKRPRRTIKKPIKYNDDIALTSSDEELHIFTPKKTKQSCCKEKTVSQTSDDIIIIKDEKESILFKKSVNDEKVSKKEKKLIKDINQTKPAKLAPIFSKPQPNASALEAKIKFLQSGVPEQLKKLMSKQKSCNTGSNDFPIVVHIQQLDTTSVLSDLNLPKENCLEEFNFENSNYVFAKLLNLSMSQNIVSLHTKSNVNMQTALKNLKEAYPRFPVYRTYKLLRGKKKGEFKDSSIFSNLDNSVEILNCSIDMQNDNPDQLTWCDKYKPLSGNEIIGNFDSIRELKKWLVTWTENDTKCKVNGYDSDSSDYYQSEPDSRDSMKSNNNLLILTGPTGCGKTSAVYAVAAELSIKVIEVNSSSKRTGKIMLQDLQEATQSHKVNRGTGSGENSQKTQDITENLPEVVVKKRGRPKKIEQGTPKKFSKQKSKEKMEMNSISVSQESTRTAMSLILIDDADIVFDQDDGFCSAITQLVQCSKRPVILVTESLTLPHLQKFLQCSKILKMHALLPNMLGTWLDLMCLADSGTCWPGIGAKFLNFFKGDMRKTINCLQFYLGSQDQSIGHTNSQNSDEKISVDDENSCMSWIDHDNDKNVNEICDTDTLSVWDSFLKEYVHLKHINCSMKMFDIWWSVPKILQTDAETKNTDDKNKNQASLDSLSNVLDSISVCDYISHSKFETEANLISRPWYDAECNSVSELENLDHYDQKYDTTKELCRELVIGSFTTAQENMRLDKKYDIDFSGMSIKRKRDRIVTRHTDLASYLSPQSSLDRRALALDYWSSCRAICRIEKTKTDSNSKRNNRFCHYLKSLSVLCKSESFDSLANSLQPSGL